MMLKGRGIRGGDTLGAWVNLRVHPPSESLKVLVWVQGLRLSGHA
jgi:hypothetical protein